MCFACRNFLLMEEKAELLQKRLTEKVKTCQLFLDRKEKNEYNQVVSVVKGRRV